MNYYMLINITSVLLIPLLVFSIFAFAIEKKDSKLRKFIYYFAFWILNTLLIVAVGEIGLLAENKPFSLMWALELAVFFGMYSFVILLCMWFISSLIFKYIKSRFYFSICFLFSILTIIFILAIFIS